MRSKEEIRAVRDKLRAWMDKHSPDPRNLTGYGNAEWECRLGDIAIQVEVLDWALGARDEEPNTEVRAAYRIPNKRR